MSPDEGGTKRSLKLCKNLQKKLKEEVPMVICYKQRLKANMVSEIRVLGDIEGKDVVLCDDICDTAGTLCKAAAIIKQNGAKSVRAVISHGVLSGPAIERIENSVLEELIITDSIEFDQSRCSKIKVLNTEAIFGKVITAIQTHTSISESL